MDALCHSTFVEGLSPLNTLSLDNSHQFTTLPGLSNQLKHNCAVPTFGLFTLKYIVFLQMEKGLDFEEEHKMNLHIHYIYIYTYIIITVYEANVICILSCI